MSDGETRAQRDLEQFGPFRALNGRPRWAIERASEINRTDPDGMLIYRMTAYKKVLLVLEIADALVEVKG